MNKQYLHKIDKRIATLFLWAMVCGWAFPLQAQISLSFSVTHPTCPNYTNGLISLSITDGQAPYEIAWSNGESGLVLGGLSAGDYGVTVTDANGDTVSETVSLVEPPLLIAEISLSNDVCATENGLSVSVEGGTAPYEYVWSDGSTDASIASASPGIYNVTITDAKGCNIVATKVINEPLSVAVRTIDVICAGFCDGSAEAIITGGVAPFSFIWSNGNTNQVTDLLPPGTYEVTVTDGNGCQATGSGAVSAPEDLELSVNVTGSCDEDEAIVAKASATGGIPPYVFAWSNGVISETNENLERGGSYDVTVTDANGCNTQRRLNVPMTPGLILFVDSQNTACNSITGGSASVEAEGGVGPYNFSWDNGATTNSLSDLTAGVYSVTVTDTEGCSGEASVEIQEGTSLTIFPGSINSSCPNTADGMANALVEGGTAPYSFLWSDGQTTGTAINLLPGTYTVTSTDAIGCEGIATITVGSDSDFSVSVDATTVSCDGPADGVITLTYVFC